jgi:hypothetical protein
VYGTRNNVRPSTPTINEEAIIDALDAVGYIPIQVKQTTVANTAANTDPFTSSTGSTDRRG